MARKNTEDASAKPKKPPLGRRFGESLRAASDLGADAVRNPAGIPHTAHGAFRGWFRKVWNTRGGSIYTLGYALTFAALEVKTFVTGIAGMTNAGDFVIEQLWQFLIRFSADSISNLVLACMWPVFIVTWQPPWGACLFVVAMLLFPKYIKPPVERWLFGDAALNAGETQEDN
jgi:hypothetical protein